MCRSSRKDRFVGLGVTTSELAQLRLLEDGLVLLVGLGLVLLEHLTDERGVELLEALQLLNLGLHLALALSVVLLQTIEGGGVRRGADSGVEECRAPYGDVVLLHEVLLVLGEVELLDSLELLEVEVARLLQDVLLVLQVMVAYERQ